MSFELYNLKLKRLRQNNNSPLTVSDLSTSTIKVGWKRELAVRCKDMLLTLRFYSQKPFFVSALPAGAWESVRQLELPSLRTLYAYPTYIFKRQVYVKTMPLEV